MYAASRLRRGISFAVSSGVSNTILSDSALMAALGREMTRAVARQSVAASNLANADTPGYRAREVRFSDELDSQMSGQMTATQPGHLGAPRPGADTASVAEVTNLPARRDGNTVQIERELLSLTSAGTDFATAQTVLAAKFRLVRYAINEGR